MPPLAHTRDLTIDENIQQLLLSGFIFSIATMPFALRMITYIIPARYFVTVTRGVFLKGVGYRPTALPPYRYLM